MIEVRSAGNGGDPKYSCSIIIPKTDIETVNAINAAVDCAIKEGIGKFGGKVPPKQMAVMRDPDTLMRTGMCISWLL